MKRLDMLADLPQIKNLDKGNFFVMAGPCAVESAELAEEIALHCKNVCEKLGIPYIFKASYRKANRSRLDSFCGIGDQDAMKILGGIREKIGVPVVTDIHSAAEASLAAEYVDILQIPAFLCRQTDILVAAAETGKYVNIKKGQFLAPESMRFASQKVVDSGNDKIILTDRGTMFGYHDLVVDVRSIPMMQQIGFPVVMDITHSLQQPNQTSGVTGGMPTMIDTIARAVIATGVDGLFIETHPDPKNAKSDGANMLPLDMFEPLMERLVKIRQAINNF